MVSRKPEVTEVHFFIIDGNVKYRGTPLSRPVFGLRLTKFGSVVLYLSFLCLKKITLKCKRLSPLFTVWNFMQSCNMLFFYTYLLISAQFGLFPEVINIQRLEKRTKKVGK